MNKFGVYVLCLAVTSQVYSATIPEVSSLSGASQIVGNSANRAFDSVNDASRLGQSTVSGIVGENLASWTNPSQALNNVNDVARQFGASSGASEVIGGVFGESQDLGSWTNPSQALNNINSASQKFLPGGESQIHGRQTDQSHRCHHPNGSSHRVEYSSNPSGTVNGATHVESERFNDGTQTFSTSTSSQRVRRSIDEVQKYSNAPSDALDSATKTSQRVSGSNDASQTLDNVTGTTQKFRRSVNEVQSFSNTPSEAVDTATTVSQRTVNPSGTTQILENTGSLKYRRSAGTPESYSSSFSTPGGSASGFGFGTSTSNGVTRTSQSVSSSSNGAPQIITNSDDSSEIINSSNDPSEVISNSAVFSDISENSAESKPTELEIIGLCSEVPRAYEDVVNLYLTMPSSSTEQLEFMQTIEDRLKTKTEELRQSVANYDQRVAKNDPDARNIQNLMYSAVEELNQSVDKINKQMNTEIEQNLGTMSPEDRFKTIQGFVRPAIVKFEEFCLLQTKDILKNVLQEYEESVFP